MVFDSLFKNLLQIPFLSKALLRLEQGKGSWLSGAWGAARAFTAAALVARLKKPAVFVCVDEAQALELHEELRFFLQGYESMAFSVKYPTVLDPGVDPLVFFPALEAENLDAVNREHGKTIERLLVLRRLARGEKLVLVTSLPAVLQRLTPPETMLGASLSLESGRDYAFEGLASQLVALGYRREALVTEPGQFSVRGGILDVSAPDADWPLRAEFFGDRLEELRFFDPETQRSRDAVPRFEVMPFQELILEKAVKEEGLRRILQSPLKKEPRERWHARIRDQELFAGQDWLIPFFHQATLFDYLGCLEEKPLFLMDQPQLWREAVEGLHRGSSELQRRRAEQHLLYPEAGQALASYEDLQRAAAPLPRLGLSLLPHSASELADLEPLAATFRSLDLRPGDFEHLKTELATLMGQGLKCLGACHSHGELLRVRDELLKRGLPAPEVPSERSLESLGEGETGLMLGKLARGFSSLEAGFAIFSDQEAFRRQAIAPPRVYRHRYKGLKGARKIDSFAELKEGQHAVHLRHGIGIFRGVARLDIEGKLKDFVCLEYQDREKLYVPVDQVNLVQKYLGGEEHPKLHKLGGLSWQAAQEKVKKSVAELAGELLKIYASRELAKAPGFGADSKWQKEFEESFPFEETEDQLRAISEVKGDLEGGKPMDRLLCGDVGFGKTEVALRACFKAVMGGSQAAVLVPTTILASQHFATFSERLRDFPVKLALLSRFRSPKEQKETVEGLAAGTIDLVIGTHRLLSKDVRFKKLGLMVVDEEQRFGVAHKERLKKFRAQVGVLAMSATPVPRTLHFSLSGLRDMSLIETAPLDRLPVRTYVLEDNPQLMRDAIVKELGRKGQVFFVHNRVKDIEKVAQKLRELVPEAAVAVGHGQMPKEDLERVMVEFHGRVHDILVATTIIESGLDIPNVNTIVINHAEDFGLSQLYQLRGRVGRSERQAYAYLFYPKGRSLPEVAEKRLAAIEEFTELGSGFRVAMRDLEIRGVGNILGPQQHGHVSAVGFDLYCHLLRDAVARLRGEEVAEDRTPTLSLDMDAYIPSDYISDERSRMDWYKRLAACSEAAELKELGSELKDRYGEPPRPVEALLEAVDVRLMALELGLSEVTQKSTQLVLRYFEDRLPEGAFVPEMMRQFKDKIRFLQGPPPGLSLDCPPGQGLATLRTLLPHLKRYVKIAGSKELAPQPAP